MATVQGVIDETQNPIPGLTRFITRGWYQDQLPYAVGGVTFVYPVGLFTTTPTVEVVVELSLLAYATTLLVVPMVTANSAVSTTVRVNILSGLVSEAGAGSVVVHLRAI